MSATIGRCVGLALVASLLTNCSGSAPHGAQASPSPQPTPSAITPDLAHLKDGHPGESLELSSYVVPGKTTLFEFYSERCQHSAKMAPVMAYLAAHRGDLAVRQVDNDRPDAAEVDIDSPLAEQYGISETPSFRIYDPEGALIADGSAAKDQVRQWYQESQLFEHAEQLPGIAERYRSPN